jgi:hypothetical protein
MLKTPRLLYVALPLVVVALLWPGRGFFRPSGDSRATIEPTLPLVVDLRERPADPARGTPPGLQAIVDAKSDLQDVSFTLLLPDGLSGDAGTLTAERGRAYKAGERRAFVVPLQELRAGEFAIRLEVSFRLPDGRVLHTQQGMMWRAGARPREGRLHAGAYEWMGVPVAEPQP